MKQLEGCAVLPPLEEPGSPTQQPGSKPAKKPGKIASRFRMLNSFADYTLRGLGHNEVRVWLLLYRDCKGGIAKSSQKHLAERAGICERTVRRALKRLIERGLVEVARRGRLGQGVSHYRLHTFEKDQ